MPWQVVEQEKSIDRLRLSFFVVVIFLFRVFRFASFSHMNPSGISCAQQQYCQIDVHTTAILLHYIIIDMIDIATDCWKLVPNVRTLQPNQNRLSQNIIYNLVLSGFWARDFFFVLGAVAIFLYVLWLLHSIVSHFHLTLWIGGALQQPSTVYRQIVTIIVVCAGVVRIFAERKQNDMNRKN